LLCALIESGLSPRRVEFEITESIALEVQLNILPMIRQLKNLGISIALDDFGIGYSSLSYLTMFPFDRIKIDKSFTQNMTRRSDARPSYGPCSRSGNVSTSPRPMRGSKQRSSSRRCSRPA
jgi:EAL domain-containing protein (putative c-di-GMP-specific phosphodiesterase class I)